MNFKDLSIFAKISSYGAFIIIISMIWFIYTLITKIDINLVQVELNNNLIGK